MSGASGWRGSLLELVRPGWLKYRTCDKIVRNIVFGLEDEESLPRLSDFHVVGNGIPIDEDIDLHTLRAL